MEYFEIILPLSRMALNGDQDRIQHQIERLREALKESDPKQAEKLERLLTRHKQRHDLAPVSLKQMRSRLDTSVLPGDTLSRTTPIPTDRETGAPLVRLVFPDEHDKNIPILESDLADAVADHLKEWGRLEDLARVGVKPNMSCLLYGEPGVGKTILARFIGYHLRLPIVEARLDGLVSSFLGTTARNIGMLFDFAARHRCILFLDEFDAIAKARDDSQEIGEIKRVVNALLQCLDARKDQGFTLAATNHEHLLDPAVWRRFDARIQIPKPNSNTRAVMLKRFLEPVRLPDSYIRMLVWLTDGMSGSDLESLITGGKRYLVMHEREQDESRNEGSFRIHGLFPALRRQVTLNGLLFNDHQRELLLRNDAALPVALIENAGLTQTEVASVLGISQSTVSRRLTEHEQKKELQVNSVTDERAN